VKKSGFLCSLPPLTLWGILASTLCLAQLGLASLLELATLCCSQSSSSSTVVLLLLGAIAMAARPTHSGTRRPLSPGLRTAEPEQEPAAAAAAAIPQAPFPLPLPVVARAVGQDLEEAGISSSPLLAIVVAVHFGVLWVSAPRGPNVEVAPRRDLNGARLLDWPTSSVSWRPSGSAMCWWSASLATTPQQALGRPPSIECGL
jgi:hypothetical protein